MGHPVFLRDFRTYQLAKQYFKECERIVLSEPMRSQLARATLSILNNLAEGSAMLTAKERARFYRIALGSFRESQAMLDLAGQEDLLRRYDFLGICLYNLHRYTLQPRNSPNPHPSDPHPAAK